MEQVFVLFAIVLLAFQVTMLQQIAEYAKMVIQNIPSHVIDASATTSGVSTCCHAACSTSSTTMKCRGPLETDCFI